MAITDNSESTQQTTQQAPQQQTHNTFGAAAQQTKEKKPVLDSFLSFHSAGMFGSAMPRGNGDEYVQKLIDGLAEDFKHADEKYKITVTQVLNTEEVALLYSCLVITGQHKDLPNLVAHHTLLIAATNDVPAPKFEHINGQPNIEIMYVAGDAMDSKMSEIIRTRVVGLFPGKKTLSADGCVVPATLNPDDKSAVRRLAVNIGQALATTLCMSAPDFVDFNIGRAKRDTQLSINIGFGSQQVEDAVGNPQRSDVMLRFSSQRPGGQKTGSLNTGDREIVLAETSGFIDFVWAPVQQYQPSPLFIQQQQQQMIPNNQKYAARLVLTNINSNFSYTPAMMLMAILTATAVRDDNNWIQSLRPAPQSSNGEIDLRDVGALNIEGNLQNDPSGYGGKIETKVDTFKLSDLGALVNALVRQGLIVSVDVPETGPQSWYTSILMAAASGWTEAITPLVDAANELTNGEFSRIMSERPNADLFVDRNNRVHMGYWIDRTGAKRDIREIDTLAVANKIGEHNPELIRDWSDTFTQTNYPLEQRLAARKRMLMALTNETAVFTGYAQRVTLSAEFIDALVRGARQAGLQTIVNTPLSMVDFNNQRGFAAFASSAISLPGETFGVRSMMPGYNQGAAFAGYNRWSMPSGL